MKRYLIKFFIIVGSLQLNACTPSAEDYAKQWCELNHKIESSTEDQKQALFEAATRLEKEIYEAYGQDQEKMNIIYTITDACD